MDMVMIKGIFALAMIPVMVFLTLWLPDRINRKWLLHGKEVDGLRFCPEISGDARVKRARQYDMDNECNGFNPWRT
jgi:hypothetical protein